MTALDDHYRTISVEAVTPVIGGVVSGVDARQPLSPAQFAEVHAALMNRGVLFFRDQDLTDEQQFAFARNFGAVARSAFLPSDVEGEQAYIDWLEDTADDPPKADLWHTDVVFKPEPPDFAVLNCRVAPPVGGDTLWLSLYALYESLSPLLQQFVDGLEFHAVGVTTTIGVTDPAHSKVVYIPNSNYDGCVQPLVRVHPVTGRNALYLGGANLESIVGLKRNESDALIALLRSQLNDPGLQCRWRWCDHDLVIWDERCTNHRATSDHYPVHRLMRRCTVGSARPVGPRHAPAGNGVG
jgi:taurine dioxygenase